jgi:hypothetical protein
MKRRCAIYYALDNTRPVSGLPQACEFRRPGQEQELLREQEQARFFQQRQGARSEELHPFRSAREHCSGESPGLRGPFPASAPEGPELPSGPTWFHPK